MGLTFKDQYSHEERRQEASRVIMKYPDRIPIICERNKTASYDCPIIDKNKYLVPKDFTFGQLLYVIRKRIKLPNDKALFLFVNKYIPPTTARVGDVYKNYQDSDLFLYVTYSYENVFG